MIPRLAYLLGRYVLWLRRRFLGGIRPALSLECFSCGMLCALRGRRQGAPCPLNPRQGRSPWPPNGCHWVLYDIRSCLVAAEDVIKCRRHQGILVSPNHGNLPCSALVWYA